MNPSAISKLVLVDPRFDSLMREQAIAVDAGPLVTNRNMSLGLPTPRDEAPSLGFTAVNVDQRRQTSFRPDDSMNSFAPSKSVSTTHTHPQQSLSPSPERSRVKAHGWRPEYPSRDERPNGLPYHDHADSRKRKRTDSYSDEREAHRTLHVASTDRLSIDADSPSSTPSPGRHSQRPVDSTERGDDREGSFDDHSQEDSSPSRTNNGSVPSGRPPEPRPEVMAQIADSLREHMPKPSRPQQSIVIPSEGRSLSPTEHSTEAEGAKSYDKSKSDHSGVDEGSGKADMVDMGAEGADKKQRKRNFANRTKTGCHTCRTRKKKCDEGKPSCQNCLRGSFPCGGYGPKPPPNAKPHARSGPVQIQSKQPYDLNRGPPSYYDMTNTSPTFHFSWNDRDRLGSLDASSQGQRYGRGAPAPPPSNSYGVQNFRPQSSRDNWSRPPWGPPEPGHPPHLAERPPTNDYSQMGSSVDVFPPHHRGPPGEPWVPFPPNGTSSHPHLGSQGGMMGPRDSVSTMSGPRGDQPPPPILRNLNSERGRMITGRSFKPFMDDELLADRRGCAEAVQAFNDAGLAKSSISKDERSRFFKSIIDPATRRPNILSDGWPGPVGVCGNSTVVETPFWCEYGYNLHLGTDVIISPGCEMQDCAEIHIGNKTIIGPNVKFYCMSASVDANQRAGSRGSFMAGAIVVEDDVFIGANVTILPFRTIGKGAVVGAGSVVTRDVKPNTVVAGNPAKFVRTIEAGAPKVDLRQRPDIQEQNDRMLQRMRDCGGQVLPRTAVI